MVTLYCRGKQVTAFVNCPVFNGKAVVYNSTINKLFMDNFGFIPQVGETISIG